MTTKPLFSIIIPTLNEEECLPRLLKNLKQQTLPDFEVIIVDTQSSDNTLSLARLYSPKLPLKILTCQQKNVGLQRNLGANTASAEILLFFDADTQIPPSFLAQLQSQLRHLPTDFFSTWCQPDNQQLPSHALSQASNLVTKLAQFTPHPKAMGSMLGCQRQAFRQINGFDPTVCFAEDSELIHRAIRQGFHFHIFRQPQFTFSFRRFRQKGFSKTTYQCLKLHSIIALRGYHHLSQKEYPMTGGG